MPESKPKKVVHYRKSEMEFAAFGGPPGKAAIARLVGPEMSKTMGAGIATFDGCSIEWTVLYDELIVVLEGTFRLVVGKDTHSCAPGDVIWIPENTPIFREVVFHKIAVVTDPAKAQPAQM